MELLEPCAGKLARTVLRGERCCEPSDLPDHNHPLLAKALVSRSNLANSQAPELKRWADGNSTSNLILGFGQYF